MARKKSITTKESDVTKT